MSPARWTLVALVLLGHASARGLDPSQSIEQYGLDNWTSREGLPQNSVNVILQTRDGYTWLGTEEGLVRFDGVHFTVYSTRTIAAFRQNTVAALAQTTDGDLWIGTDEGLIRRHGDLFTLFGRKDGLPWEAISALEAGPDGTLWIGTENGGLAFRSAAGRFSTAADRAGGLPDDSVAALALSRDGSLWIGTGGGLARLHGGLLTSYARQGGAAAEGISDILESKDGTLWIASASGLLRFGGERVLETWTRREGMPEGAINALLEDRDGSLWIGAAGGLARMRAGRIERFTSAEGLPTNFVFSFCEDREGSLWVGTVGAGVLRLRQAPVRTYTTRDGMSSDFVRVVIEATDGTLWVGTRSGGVNLLRNGRAVGAITERDGLPSDSVTALAPSSEGAIWVGTLGGGIALVSNGKVRSLPAGPGRPTGTIRALLEDRGGALWIGADGEGLTRYEHGTFRRFTSAEGLAGDDVRALAEGPGETLWVGTLTGLSRFRAGKLEERSGGEGTSGHRVVTLLVDPDGTVWIGTRGGGLLRLRNGHVSAVAARNGLFDDVVFSILDDKRGNLWMSCNRGIFRVRRRDLEDFFSGRRSAVASVSYSEADGMESAECNGSFQPSAWRSRDGGLWFPTIRGVAAIHPSAIRINEQMPPVILERFVVDRRTVPLGPKITIPPGSHSLELHYTGLSFLAPEKMLFRYRLEGFDDGWVDAGGRRAAYYTNLGPGGYVFRVIAANSDGVWNLTGASLPFSIRPTFTQTPAFAIGGAVALAAALFGIFRLRMRRLNSRARELERAVAEAVSNIRTLRGLFPICAACKKIRDDKGYWKQIESYVRDHSEAEFSHSICPDCMVRLYPEFVDPPVGKEGSEPRPS